MNIVFWFGILFIMTILWFGLSSLYKPIGNFLFNLFNNIKKESTNDEKENETNED